MIVNTFIITPKPEYREALMITSHAQKSIMAALLPEKYRTLFKSIVKDSVHDVIDNREPVRAYSVMAEAMLTGHGELWYPTQGTEPLQHVIRRTFYETLLIIANDYNPHSYDYFLVVLSQEVITERQWASRHNQKQPTNGSAKRKNGQILVCDFTRTA